MLSVLRVSEGTGERERERESRQEDGSNVGQPDYVPDVCTALQIRIKFNRFSELRGFTRRRWHMKIGVKICVNRPIPCQSFVEVSHITDC